MTLSRTVTLLALVALALPGLAAAQGLGDAAARERAKRDAAKKPAEAKVFTNEDLNEGGAGTPAEAGATPSSGNARPATEGARRKTNPDEEDRPAEETDPGAQEQVYLEAVSAAQSRVSEVEARVKELQARLNPMSPTFVYGDFNGLGGDKVAEEARVKSDLAAAEGELNAARQAVIDATRALEGFRRGRAPASVGR